MPEGAPTRRAAGGRQEPETPSQSVAWEWAKSGLFAFALFLVMRTFLLQTFVITSGSMENTLLVGDYLIVNRAAIGSRLPFTGEPGLRIPGYSHAERGDVIVFDPPHEQELKLVKRLIGMPGDTLEMRDKALYRNGVLQDEPYVRHDDPAGDDSHPWMRWQLDYLAPGVDRNAYRPTRDTWGPIVVPEDRYFMLGDNRDRSLDSRYWGLLEGWRLEGRASRIYYSYDKQSLKPFRFFREVRAGRIGAQVR
ncbi:MAG: signal peptidase I [Gemmatimonadetes bacterium]|nr:signal peptidase I [Gemmatimonadota bacterium]